MKHICFFSIDKKLLRNQNCLDFHENFYGAVFGETRGHKCTLTNLILISLSKSKIAVHLLSQLVRKLYHSEPLIQSNKVYEWYNF